MVEPGILNSQGDTEVQCQSESHQASMREARLPKKSHCCNSVTFHSGCCSSTLKKKKKFQSLHGNIFPLLLCSLSLTLLFSWPGTCNPSVVTAGSLMGRSCHWHENHSCFPLLVLQISVHFRANTHGKVGSSHSINLSQQESEEGIEYEEWYFNLSEFQRKFVSTDMHFLVCS